MCPHIYMRSMTRPRRVVDGRVEAITTRQKRISLIFWVLSWQSEWTIKILRFINYSAMRMHPQDLKWSPQSTDILPFVKRDEKFPRGGLRTV